MADRVTTFRSRIAGQIVAITSTIEFTTSADSDQKGGFVLPYDAELLGFLVAFGDGDALDTAKDITVGIHKNGSAVAAWAKTITKPETGASRSVDVGKGTDFDAGDVLEFDYAVASADFAAATSAGFVALLRIKN